MVVVVVVVVVVSSRAVQLTPFSNAEICDVEQQFQTNACGNASINLTLGKALSL
jgi:hypothetical protein